MALPPDWEVSLARGDLGRNTFAHPRSQIPSAVFSRGRMARDVSAIARVVWSRPHLEQGEPVRASRDQGGLQVGFSVGRRADEGPWSSENSLENRDRCQPLGWAALTSYPSMGMRDSSPER